MSRPVSQAAAAVELPPLGFEERHGFAAAAALRKPQQKRSPRAEIAVLGHCGWTELLFLGEVLAACKRHSIFRDRDGSAHKERSENLRSRRRKLHSAPARNGAKYEFRYAQDVGDALRRRSSPRWRRALECADSQRGQNVLGDEARLWQTRSRTRRRPARRRSSRKFLQLLGQRAGVDAQYGLCILKRPLALLESLGRRRLADLEGAAGLA